MTASTPTVPVVNEVLGSTDMGPCCGPPVPAKTTKRTRTSRKAMGGDVPVIALVGAPNVGKSTLFNAMTGSNVTMGNWPGSTVEISRGTWRHKPKTVSRKRHINQPEGDSQTNTASCEHQPGPMATGQQSVELASAAPTVASSGDAPTRALARELPMTASDPYQEMTIIDFPGAYSLDSTSPDEEFTRRHLVEQSPAPSLIIAVVDAAHLARSLYLVSEVREHPLRVVVAVSMSDVGSRHGVDVDIDALSEALEVPVVRVDPRRRTGLDDLAHTVRDTLALEVPSPRARMDGIEYDEDERFAWIAKVVGKGTKNDGSARQQLSDRVDRIVLAKVAGPLIFIAVMWAVFQITTTVASPLQDLLGELFAGPVSSGVAWLLSAAGLGDTWVEGLLVHGLIGGVGMLLTFVPLMALMFILLALLEDSGYLARAAVLTDRIMGALGLPGRAFLPLVVGFGCNVPAIAATRVLSQPRHRLMTVLLIPFTACSARLTVFVMLGTVFFGRWAGTAVFVMYLVSILLVVATGLVLRSTLWRAMPSEPLVIDLPPYQVPTLRLTLSVAWVRLRGFLKTAAGIIVATVVVVWILQAIPTGAGTFGHADTDTSLYAWLARHVAPIFAPAGFGAWQIVSALFVGFVAKEAIISSWGQTFAVSGTEDITGLGQQLTAVFNASSNGHALAAVAAFMVFLLAYTPCVATLAAQKREVGWRWTGVGVLIQLGVAIIMAIVVFQVARVFW
ncbi:MAG: ferrous iron transport protein B [Propionibacteriaceae bacterium]|nr:ferrous iron transport protein B [Propionibacteriaceae bacterium]